MVNVKYTSMLGQRTRRHAVFLIIEPKFSKTESTEKFNKTYYIVQVKYDVKLDLHFKGFVGRIRIYLRPRDHVKYFYQIISVNGTKNSIYNCRSMIKNSIK